MHQRRAQRAEQTVIFTAETRSESVQTVAGKVATLSAANLETIRASDFSDFAHSVPGASCFAGGPTNVAAVSDVYAGYLSAEPFVGNPLYKLANYSTLNFDLAVYIPRSFKANPNSAIRAFFEKMSLPLTVFG